MLAPHFCNRRCEESWILRWHYGPSVAWLLFEESHLELFPGCHLSTGRPCDCHVLEPHVGPRWKEAYTIARNAGYARL